MERIGTDRKRSHRPTAVRMASIATIAAARGGESRRGRELGCPGDGVGRGAGLSPAREARAFRREDAAVARDAGADLIWVRSLITPTREGKSSLACFIAI